MTHQNVKINFMYCLEIRRVSLVNGLMRPVRQRFKMLFIVWVVTWYLGVADMLQSLLDARNRKNRFVKYNTNCAKFTFDKESIHQQPLLFTLFWMACCIYSSNQVII